MACSFRWRFTKSREGKRGGPFVKVNHWPSLVVSRREGFGWRMEVCCILLHAVCYWDGWRLQHNACWLVHAALHHGTVLLGRGKEGWPYCSLLSRSLADVDMCCRIAGWCMTRSTLKPRKQSKCSRSGKRARQGESTLPLLLRPIDRLSMVQQPQ